MKLSRAVVTATAVAGAASQASAFSLGGGRGGTGGDQVAFQLPWADTAMDPIAAANKLLASVNYNVETFVQGLATYFNEQVDSIPREAYSAWAEVLAKFPNALSQMTIATADSLSSSWRRFPDRVVDDWLYVVENAKFPQHTLKVKSPESLGIDSVKQYSGYLTEKEHDKNFFFWSFESRNDPKNDPIVLWLNGGPGCSSLTGLFFELGPASINSDGKPVSNPYSWNSNATVIFLDQPVNTGYSYSSEGVSDTVTAGKDAYAFLELFFQQFPEYKELDFHIAGESYAGHYIPVFAKEILSHKDRGFDLKSVLIGNGLTDPRRQYDYYEPMACGGGGADRVVEESDCQGMRDSQDRCNGLIDSCYESESSWVCVPATIYCNNAMMGPYQRTGKNVYDVRTDCEGGNLCYTGLQYVDAYLNKPEVKAAVGAEVDQYEGCNFDINRNFLFAGDWMKPYYTAVSDLLAEGLPVLIYAGDKDFICNWLGNEAWSRQLEWAHSDEFGKQEFGNWTTADGAHAGQVINAEHFTFLRVFGAGHMVPYNQPENSLDMLNRWLRGDRTFA